MSLSDHLRGRDRQLSNGLSETKPCHEPDDDDGLTGAEFKLTPSEELFLGDIKRAQDGSNRGVPARYLDKAGDEAMHDEDAETERRNAEYDTARDEDRDDTGEDEGKKV
jgi:hypothetical protein